MWPERHTPRAGQGIPKTPSSRERRSARTPNCRHVPHQARWSHARQTRTNDERATANRLRLRHAACPGRLRHAWNSRNIDVRDDHVRPIDFAERLYGSSRPDDRLRRGKWVFSRCLGSTKMATKRPMVVLSSSSLRWDGADHSQVDC
jgi:hypothetical protein